MTAQRKFYWNRWYTEPLNSECEMKEKHKTVCATSTSTTTTTAAATGDSGNGIWRAWAHFIQYFSGGGFIRFRSTCDARVFLHFKCCCAKCRSIVSLLFSVFARIFPFLFSIWRSFCFITSCRNCRFQFFVFSRSIRPAIYFYRRRFVYFMAANFKRKCFCHQFIVYSPDEVDRSTHEQLQDECARRRSQTQTAKIVWCSVVRITCKLDHHIYRRRSNSIHAAIRCPFNLYI